jgi:hypothetical protein
MSVIDLYASVGVVGVGVRSVDYCVSRTSLARGEWAECVSRGS